MCTILLPVHVYTEMVLLCAATNGVTVGSSDTHVNCRSQCKLIEWTCRIGAVSTVKSGIWQAGNNDKEAWISTRMHSHVHTHMHRQISTHVHTNARTHTPAHIISDTHRLQSLIVRKQTYYHVHTCTHSLSHIHTHTSTCHICTWWINNVRTTPFPSITVLSQFGSQNHVYLNFALCFFLVEM